MEDDRGGRVVYKVVGSKGKGPQIELGYEGRTPFGVCQANLDVVPL